MPEVVAETRVARDLALVVLVGEVDIAKAEAVIRALEEAATPDAVRRLCCDLSGVTFLDSSGIGALVSARRTCEDRGIEMVLVGASGSVRRVLALTCVDTLFRQFATVGEFRAADNLGD